MQYRRLGRSGLQVSVLSLGSWVTYHNQVNTRAAREMLAAAMDAESAAPGIRPQLQLPAPDQLPVAGFQVQLAAKAGWENATSARVTAVASGLTALEGALDRPRAEWRCADLAAWKWLRFMIILQP
jgi:hypothetical protein